MEALPYRRPNRCRRCSSPRVHKGPGSGSNSAFPTRTFSARGKPDRASHAASRHAHLSQLQLTRDEQVPSALPDALALLELGRIVVPTLTSDRHRPERPSPSSPRNRLLLRSRRSRPIHRGRRMRSRQSLRQRRVCGASSSLQPSIKAPTESAPARTVEIYFIAFFLGLKADPPGLSVSESAKAETPLDSAMLCCRYKETRSDAYRAVAVQQSKFVLFTTSRSPSCWPAVATTTSSRARRAGTGGVGGNSGVPVTCDITLSPGENDAEALQTALIEADPDSTICLRPGTYVLRKGAPVHRNGGRHRARHRGDRATRSCSTLPRRTAGDEAIDVVQADRFTLERLTLKDPPGDGVKVSNSDRPTFRDVKAYWAAGSVDQQRRLRALSRAEQQRVDRALRSGRRRRRRHLPRPIDHRHRPPQQGARERDRHRGRKFHRRGDL